ncbi:hypothetical protein HNQ07_003431 [Deinococcus metalli]|uniref:DUF3197 domain-containing protein n=1 Tax=Deinococcus metalli TaxID=1141878 RepID=A0A7W8NQI7_9DEIO|nr:DUF3197 domain-containing protein [Deinococcus metalli]MBB5377931.1 hypothetical protein [Deinococcus metalli]GHF55034.1 hypothetical protein GCM10017781_34040 [Deinococcus metalli]
MNVADPLGVPGAPQETLNAVMARVEGSELTGGRLILVTDRQGERPRAGYAALLVTGQGAGASAVVTAAAFGPRFGAAGAQALSALVRWAEGQNLPVRETVLSASDFTRVLAEPDADEVAHLVASSNPSDPGIYTVRPVPAGS